MRLNPARVPVLFGLLAALLVVVLAGSAVGLVWSMRTTAMRNAEGLVENMAMGVEAMRFSWMCQWNNPTAPLPERSWRERCPGRMAHSAPRPLPPTSGKG